MEKRLVGGSALPTEITFQNLVTLSDRVVFRDLGGEAVLLNLDSGQYYGLDEVGSRVWDLLSQQATLSSIRDRLLEEYSIDARTLEQDMLSLIGELESHGLVAIDNE